MFTFLHCIWMLFPVAFFFLAFWAWVKRVRKMPNQENQAEYFSQAIFCTVAVAASIALDGDWLEDFSMTLSMGMIDASFARFLLFPAMLLILAYVTKPFKVEKEPDRIIPGPRYNTHTSR